jgi:hypothetical protein
LFILTEFNYDCRTRNDKNTYEYTTSENIKVLPEDAVPVDAMDTNEGWRMSGQLLIMTTETTRTTEDTFQAYIRTQDEYISQYYTHIEFLMAPIAIYILLKSTKNINSNRQQSNTNY